MEKFRENFKNTKLEKLQEELTIINTKIEEKELSWFGKRVLEKRYDYIINILNCVTFIDLLHDDIREAVKDIQDLRRELENGKEQFAKARENDKGYFANKVQSYELEIMMQELKIRKLLMKKKKFENKVTKKLRKLGY